MKQFMDDIDIADIFIYAIYLVDTVHVCVWTFV